MANFPDRVPVPGSERLPLPDARDAGAPDPNERITISVVVRPRAPVPHTVTDTGSSSVSPPIDRAEFAAAHGADPTDLERIREFAHASDLTVEEASAARRTVVLNGTIAAMGAAFGTELRRYAHPDGIYRGRTGPLLVPAEIAPIVQGVFGLDDRPQARTHYRIRAGAGVSYTPLQLAHLYDFPVGLDGAGQCIAIIELGGGYRPDDLGAYFGALGLPVPSVEVVSVDQGQNQPTGSPNSADGEVALDIEIAGALAPGARLAVYFAPNTDRGFLDAITTAIHDTARQPTVLSISWGGPESSWTAQATQAMDQAFQDAVALGLTVCCASGDRGSSDGVTDGQAHVDFPASSPHVLACGGTRLDSAGGAITAEVVWNDGNGASGGGVSGVFAQPAWQAGRNVPAPAPGGVQGRGIPDVAGNADPATGYSVQVDGQQLVFGGTSAVAPLWAGLIARLGQQTRQAGRPLGYLAPLLYALPSSSSGFHDITQGTNGDYAAGPGWDPCTGLGSPDGTQLLDLLLSAAPADQPPHA